MKRIITAALSLLFITTAFSQDMLDHVAGQWKVDLDATRKLPEVAKLLEGPETSKIILNAMLKAASESVYVFTKDSFTISFDGEEMKSGLKVLENSANKLVFEKVNQDPNVELDEKEILYVFKEGEQLLVRDNDKDKPMKAAPSMVLKRIK
jgi:hypothetical protein